MDFFDTELQLHLTRQFTSIKTDMDQIIADHHLTNANLVCWVPHEVSSIVQLGWEDGLIQDMEAYLDDLAPAGKYLAHDEPNTPFRHNFHQHLRTKLIGTVSLTLIVKNSRLYLGKYQDLFYFSPVFKHIPDQKILIRILKLE